MLNFLKISCYKMALGNDNSLLYLFRMSWTICERIKLQILFSPLKFKYLKNHIRAKVSQNLQSLSAASN